MHLKLSKQEPGFEVDIILLPKDDVEQIGFFEKMIFGQENPYTEIAVSDFRIDEW